MSGARERIRRVTGSLYWRQFMLTAGMVLLTLALLGVSFYALSYNYTLSEKRQEMRDRAVLVAQLSVDYFTAGEDAERDQEDALRSLAGVASRMTDVDFLICDTDGNVMLTTDGDLAGQTITVPADITGAVLGGDRLYEGRSTVGVYEKRQFVVGVPMTDAEGNTLGLVLAVMNSAELTQMWRSFIALFFMSSAIILVLAFITSFVTAMRQIQPLSEMVKATRAYAAGDFDVRMQETGDCSEISELAASFNAMADSLQETERQRRDFIANVSHELDISQIQNQEMRKEEFDLCESARIALLSMEKKITDRGLDVDAEIPEDSVMVQGDRDLITQVIYNLLENAAKFATPGSQLYLGLTVNGEKAYVTVRNAGATIPAEEIPLLFERFHKSDKSRSEDKDGYGLGLYIVKTILAQHKEQITVTSENGFTAFTFTMQMAR